MPQIDSRKKQGNRFEQADRRDSLLTADQARIVRPILTIRERGAYQQPSLSLQSSTSQETVFFVPGHGARSKLTVLDEKVRSDRLLFRLIFRRVCGVNLIRQSVLQPNSPIAFSAQRKLFVNLKDYIRNIPDFPKPGIMFRDITPLLSAPAAFGYAIKQFADRFREAKPTAILAAESRGFIFAAPLALELGAAFIPVRKPGKLPFATRKFQYDLEYGSDTLEMHVDAVEPGSRVLLVDDLLATGGTIEACVKLAEESQAEVIGCAFLIELAFLNGRDRLKGRDIFSLLTYDGET